MNIKIKKNMIHIDMVEQMREFMKIFGEDVSAIVSSSSTKIILSEGRCRTTK